MANDMWLNMLPWLASAQGGPNGSGNSLSDSADVYYRDPLDALRQGALGRGRIGEADYPDGYLDNVNSRREDRLASMVSGRLTDRNYQRGIHRGVKMDPVQYFWPAEFHPDMGITREMRGKWTPDGVLVPRQPMVQTVAERLTHGVSYHSMTDADKAKAASIYGVNVNAAGPDEVIDPVRSKLTAPDMPLTSW
jgi:hypothetical protein